MADFDDLIPKPAKPLLDNPFEDPFADVVRRSEPDPWALASSYYQQPEYTSTLGNPQSNTYHPNQIFDASTTLKDDLHVVEVENSAPHVLPIDPLEAELPGKDKESYVKPARFAAPIIALAPTLPKPDASPTGEKPTLEQVFPAVESLRPPVEDIAPEIPTLSNVLQASSQSPIENEKLYPQEEPLPTGASESSALLSPASSMTAALESSDQQAKSNTVSIPAPVVAVAHAPIQYPLTPSLSPDAGFGSVLERSYDIRAPDGEPPGWGNTSPLAADSIFRPVELDDDDDDKPLGASLNIDAQSVANLREDIAVKSQYQASRETKPGHQLFSIHVGDPQKVGDPINAHIIYTVTTRTSAPQFEKNSFSVLRRYSDFLWLFETLVANNPGVVVPPVPDKKPYGRFAETFVESRRLGLTRCIQKIADHPRLAKDPDLKLFLESDSFTLDIKHRKADSERGSLMSSIGSTIVGPKFYETDEWFDKKKAHLEALESQLRGLVKSLEAVSKQRADVIEATLEFAQAAHILGSSDLSKQLSDSLNVLGDVEQKAKELLEEQSREDVGSILGTVDEYIRLISSVRLTFTSRMKLFYIYKAAEGENLRVKAMHEKTLRQRGLDRQSMAPIHREIELAESKAYTARTEYDDATRLIKVEVARFEQERVTDFKTSLESLIDSTISRQNQVIDSWEHYQQLLMKRANMNPQARPIPS